MARSHRLLRGAAVIGASLLVASCSAMTPIQTAELYNAGDGVRVDVSDDVRVENLMVLTDGEGGEGLVFGALVNDSAQEVLMSVTIGDGGIQLPVLPDGSVLLGSEELVVIPQVPAAPGGMVESVVEVTGYGAFEVLVPVLDGTLPQYEEYLD